MFFKNEWQLTECAHSCVIKKLKGTPSVSENFYVSQILLYIGNYYTTRLRDRGRKNDLHDNYSNINLQRIFFDKN